MTVLSHGQRIQAVMLLLNFMFNLFHLGTGTFDVIDFQPPGPATSPPEVIYFGVYAVIRYLAGDTRAPQQFFLPVVVKSALLAWQRGAVLEKPATVAPYQFCALFADECQDKDNCGEAHILSLATQMILGNEVRRQSFPGVRVLIGGYLHSEVVTRMASAMRVPAIGFAESGDSFSDKSKFPMYLRVNTADAVAITALVRTLGELNYTKAVAWICNTATSLSMRDTLALQAGQLEVTVVIIPTGTHNGCMPSDADTYARWLGGVALARKAGAHAHVNGCLSACPCYDYGHYLANEGLASYGHFWISSTTHWLETVYMKQYIPVLNTVNCPYNVPPEQQSPSPFRSARAANAFSGFTVLQSALQATALPRWWDWFRTLKQNRSASFEPWMLAGMPDKAWTSIEDPFWMDTRVMSTIFDATWAVLRGLNSALLQIGPSFTGTQLLEILRRDSFEGLSGTVSYDANGDRQAVFRLQQFRIGCVEGAPRRLDEEMSATSDPEPSLTDLFRHLRRLKACAAPAGLENQQEVVAYLRCLQDTCADAAPSLMLTATHGAVASCLVGKAIIQGNCNADLSVFVQALPAGTTYGQVCPAQCPCTPVCQAPSGLSDATSMEAYLGCLQESCQDAPGSFLQSATGGRVANCSVAIAMTNHNCEVDLSQFLRDLNSGTLLRMICPATCAACGRGTNGTAPPPAPGPPPPGPPPMGYVIVGGYNGSLWLSSPLLFYNCSTKAPPNQALTCPPGSFYDSFSAECRLCPPGSASASAGQLECSKCLAGTFSAQKGQSTCRTCVGGTFSLDGASNCSACEKGSYNAEVQQTKCVECGAGSYADQVGLVACRLCRTGTYQPLRGQTDCDECPMTKVTTSVGSVAVDECTCEQGHHLLPEGASCGSCGTDFPEGTVHCPGGASPPILQPGYTALPGSLVIYRCLGDGAACLGHAKVGLEQGCAFGGSGVACAMCPEGQMFGTQEATCIQCSKWGIMAFWILGAVSLVIFVWRLRPLEEHFTQISLQSTVATMYVTTPFSQVCDLLQFHSILGGIHLRWPKESGDTFKWEATVMALNRFSVECFFVGDKHSFPLHYVLLANLLPLLLISTCILLAVPAVLWPGLKALRFPSPRMAVSNALSVVLLFFLTILNWGINLVFSTYGHPDGKSRSLNAFPYILTTDKLTSGMSAIAIASICVWCGGTFAVVTWLLYMLPRFRHRLFVRRCALNITIQFAEDASWWCLVQLVVKILTCITLTVFDRPESQLMFLGVTYASYTLLLCSVYPFRFHRHNVSEVLLTFSKVLVLIFAMPLLTTDDAICVSVVMCLSYILGMFFLISALVGWCRNEPLDVDRESAVSKYLQSLIYLLFPVQHNVEEVAATSVTESQDLDLRLSRYTFNTEVFRESHRHWFGRPEKALRMFSGLLEQVQALHATSQGPVITSAAAEVEATQDKTGLDTWPDLPQLWALEESAPAASVPQLPCGSRPLWEDDSVAEPEAGRELATEEAEKAKTGAEGGLGPHRPELSASASRRVYSEDRKIESE